MTSSLVIGLVGVKCLGESCLHHLFGLQPSSMSWPSNERCAGLIPWQLWRRSLNPRSSNRHDHRHQSINR